MDVQSGHEDETAAYKASCTEDHWEAATPATLETEDDLFRLAIIRSAHARPQLHLFQPATLHVTGSLLVLLGALHMQ